MNFQEFDYTFTEQELHGILGMIESKATGAETGGAQPDEFLDMFPHEPALPAPLALQFQPHDLTPGAHEAPSGMSSAVSSFTNKTHTLGDGLTGSDSQLYQQQISQVMSGVTTCLVDPLASQSTARLHASHQLIGHGNRPLLPSLLPFSPAVPAMTSAATTTSSAGMPSASVSGRSGQRTPVGEKPTQVSHSTVEKLRRDRINNLIDELRELVPPFKNGVQGEFPMAGPNRGADNSEARRPKHVVLADTIALLKNLQIKMTTEQQVAQMQPPPRQPQSLPLRQQPPHPYTAGNGSPPLPHLVKEEPMSEPSNNGSVSSREDTEDKDMDSGAPKLPHIPMHSPNAGVTVERGPAEVLYVQVKCRDRRGLLSDIINALKNLPLEVRTAAVTTMPDGFVRDVFEVKADNDQVQPETIQNIVHDALFCRYINQAETILGAPKRPRPAEAP